MLEITKVDENNPIRFMRYRKHTTILSIVIAIMAILSLSVNKLNWGLDFTGGTLVEVGFSQPANLSQLRDVLGREKARTLSVLAIAGRTTVHNGLTLGVCRPW